MPNNIIRHVEHGDLDLRLPDLGRPDLPHLWERLLEDRRPVAMRQLMCAGICLAAGRIEWMHVYNRLGGRVAAHESKEAERLHQTNESDEHKAYKERTVRVAESAGHRAEAEVRSADGKIRTDVLVLGADGVRTGFEIQRSSISTQTVAKRNKAAIDHGISPAWHTDQRDLSIRNEVPWTRTDNLSPEAITDGRDLLIRSGLRTLATYQCDASSPVVCPDRGHGRCGKLHFNPEVLTLHFDEYVRQVAAGTLVKVAFKQGRRTNQFWVPTADRDRYEDSIGEMARTAVPPRQRQATSAMDGDPTCRTRPAEESIAVRQSFLALDWRTNKVGAPLPCRYCGKPAALRDAVWPVRPQGLCRGCRDDVVTATFTADPRTALVSQAADHPKES